ncbi:MAG: ABC transporter substrate-binding protein [Candidatus Binataceae bacterium]
MLRKQAAMRFATAIALAALAGCASPGPHRAPGVIQVDLENSPASADPRIATDAVSSRVNELIFDSLVKAGRNGNFENHLAESVQRPSATQIIFHLRHGIRFSDGRPFTSRDVKYTYDWILNPANLSAKRAGMRELKSIAAPDDYTVAMTTAEPYAPALEMAAQGIVPYGTPGPARAGAPAPPGTGPYKMVNFVPDESLRLDRNPFAPHRAGAPKAIIFKIVPDQTVRALELAEGVCDFSENNLPPGVLPYLNRRPGLSVSESPGSSYTYLEFNFRDPRLRDLRVRRAIAYAIDRKAIVDSMMRGTARIATGMLAPENWAYDGEVTTYPYDPAKSRELLEAAGYPAGADGMRNLRFVYKTTPENSQLAVAIQAMLKRVGISMDIRVNDFATFYSDIQRGNFDLTAMDWVGINDPNHYYFIFDSKMTPPHGYNRGGYSNPAMDQLVEAGAVTLDPSTRKKIYAQVQQLAAAGLPYVSLWWNDTVVVTNRRIAGFTPYPNGSLRSLATVTLTGPAAAEAAP